MLYGYVGRVEEVHLGNTGTTMTTGKKETTCHTRLGREVTFRYCGGSKGTRSDKNLSRNTKDFLLLLWQLFAPPNDICRDRKEARSGRRPLL